MLQVFFPIYLKILVTRVIRGTVGDRTLIFVTGSRSTGLPSGCNHATRAAPLLWSSSLTSKLPLPAASLAKLQMLTTILSLWSRTSWPDHPSDPVKTGSMRRPRASRPHLRPHTQSNGMVAAKSSNPPATQIK